MDYSCDLFRYQPQIILVLLCEFDTTPPPPHLLGRKSVEPVHDLVDLPLLGLSDEEALLERVRLVQRRLGLS